MRGVNVGAIWREGIELERKRKMEEDKKILGITEEELEQVKEDFDAEDIEDFDLVETKVVYEVWVLGYDSEMNATDFEYFIDGGYSEQEEARKCFDYFSDIKNLSEVFENKKITIPENTKHLHLFLEECIEVDDGEGGTTTECQDVLDEVKIL